MKNETEVQAERELGRLVSFEVETDTLAIYLVADTLLYVIQFDTDLNTWSVSEYQFNNMERI
jgi:hypothetical protein